MGFDESISVDSTREDSTLDDPTLDDSALDDSMFDAGPEGGFPAKNAGSLVKLDKLSSLDFFRFLTHQKKTIAIITARPPTPTPMPIPIFAPIERPELGLGPVCPLAAAVEVDVDVGALDPLRIRSPPVAVGVGGTLEDCAGLAILICRDVATGAGWFCV